MNTDFDIKTFKQIAARDYAVRYTKDGFYFTFYNHSINEFYITFSVILLRILFRTGYKKFANADRFAPNRIEAYIKYVYGKQFRCGVEYYVRAFENIDYDGNSLLDIRIKSEDDSIDDVIGQFQLSITKHLKRWPSRKLTERLFCDLASMCRLK